MSAEDAEGAENGNTFLSTKGTRRGGELQHLFVRGGRGGRGEWQHLLDPIKCDAKWCEENLLSTEDAEGAEKGNTFGSAKGRLSELQLSEL